VAKHADEQLLTMRELRVVPEQHREASYSPPEDEVYTLYEYEGTSWASGQWSQKVFPRAILIVPRRPRDYGAFRRAFTHRGCEFQVADHMSYTVFHLENRV
jgi:hypothetical protein